MHHFIFETSLTVHARTGLLLRFASRRKEEPPGAIKMGNNMLKLTLGTPPKARIWLPSNRIRFFGSKADRAVLALLQSLLRSDGLSTAL
ncbi:hypothetical protein KCV06_g672, partial [Aureobasidium melanogenum]